MHTTGLRLARRLPLLPALAVTLLSLPAAVSAQPASVASTAVWDSGRNLPAVRTAIEPAMDSEAVRAADPVRAPVRVPDLVAALEGGAAPATAHARPSVAQPAPAATTTTVSTRTPTAARTPSRSSSGSTPSSSSSSSSGYRGTNHMWIPSLGVSRSVSFFSCTSSAYPGNVVYRWGCAGTNNVYLFGHAHSVFKPLHDAYYNGKLRTGMKVIYADSKGKVRTYKVSYWKVVSPVGSSWAYAAQASPSMTLQTCVGPRSEKRLIVRLVLA
jgi:sortase (surface protein transpeptidase)